jgi:oligopeptidase A
MTSTSHTHTSSPRTEAFALLNRTGEIPFDQLSAAEIQPSIDLALKNASAELEAIKNAPGPRTFENTMRALDNLGLSLDYAMGLVSHLESVATTDEWRAEYNAVLPKVSEFKSKIVLDEGLWSALKSFAETPEARALSGEKKRFLTKTLDDFRRSGADLPPDKKARLAAINTELAQVTNTFSQNVLDATNEFEFVTTNEADLAGLPQSAREMGRSLAAAKGREGWRFTLQGPSLIAIMTYADSRALRETFYQAHNTRCASGAFNNVENLYRILELRSEKAKLLGFKDFSDLVLADRMAKSGEQAMKFVSDMRAQIEGHFRRDQEELKNFVRSELKENPDTMEPWDLSYYAEKMRLAYYDFDEEELRPYFPLPKVLNGLFQIINKTFGISLRENRDLETWDKEVTTFSAYDSKSSELLGHFYVDLFPRENKRGGAWMNGFITHVTHNDPLPHVGLIAGNFTPPAAQSPSLLTHDEVVTLFHEFGHLMHLLCSRTELRSLSMDGVAWDFIELPSQILENWCWERDSLDLFAAHHVTGERLPEELFQKMTEAKNFRSASLMMRQLGFSTVDLNLHRVYSRESHGAVLDYCREQLNAFSALPLPATYSMITSFTHLFSSPVGYAAGYYSYQWAEVLDADAFSRFQREGFMNPATGLEFREKILSRGDTSDPGDLFRQFMGRDPNPKALLERSGLS